MKNNKTIQYMKYKELISILVSIIVALGLIIVQYYLGKLALTVYNPTHDPLCKGVFLTWLAGVITSILFGLITALVKFTIVDIYILKNK